MKNEKTTTSSPLSSLRLSPLRLEGMHARAHRKSLLRLDPSSPSICRYLHASTATCFHVCWEEMSLFLSFSTPCCLGSRLYFQPQPYLNLSLSLSLFLAISLSLSICMYILSYISMHVCTLGYVCVRNANDGKWKETEIFLIRYDWRSLLL